jgi:protein disulfide-isomerase
MKSMIIALAAYAAASFTAAAYAADSTPAQGQSQWTTDYSAAMAQAKAERKILVLDFTGSDWCAPCIKLKKEVFETSEFKAFAEKHLVCVELDFPRRKRLPEALVSQNGYLQNKFQVTEFPTVVILDSDGKLLGKLGYNGGGATAWLNQLKQLMAKRAAN